MVTFETIGTNQQIFIKCFQNQFAGTGKLLNAQMEICCFILGEFFFQIVMRLPGAYGFTKTDIIGNPHDRRFCQSICVTDTLYICLQSRKVIQKGITDFRKRNPVVTEIAMECCRNRRETDNDQICLSEQSNGACILTGLQIETLDVTIFL